MIYNLQTITNITKNGAMYLLLYLLLLFFVLVTSSNELQLLHVVNLFTLGRATFSLWLIYYIYYILYVYFIYNLFTFITLITQNEAYLLFLLRLHKLHLFKINLQLLLLKMIHFNTFSCNILTHGGIHVVNFTHGLLT